jgi:hypothetical protein
MYTRINYNFFIKLFSTAAFGVCVLSSPAALLADHHEKKDVQVMTPEETKMMEEMKTATSPGEHHKLLKDLTGDWEYVITMWMNENAKPEYSKGKSKNTLIFGNRYLKSEITGKFMGEKFEGLGYTGYDNVKEKYVMTWLDNAGTGIMQSTATYDPATKTMSEQGTMSCAMKKNPNLSFRGEQVIIDKNKYIYTMFMPGENGKEYKSMVIEYTRKGKKK